MSNRYYLANITFSMTGQVGLDDEICIHDRQGGPTITVRGPSGVHEKVCSALNAIELIHQPYATPTQVWDHHGNPWEHDA